MAVMVSLVKGVSLERWELLGRTVYPVHLVRQEVWERGENLADQDLLEYLVTLALLVLVEAVVGVAQWAHQDCKVSPDLREPTEIQALLETEDPLVVLVSPEQMDHQVPLVLLAMSGPPVALVTLEGMGLLVPQENLGIQDKKDHRVALVTLARMGRRVVQVTQALLEEGA
jgi:hypothetical protein